MACSHSYIGRKHNLYISMKGNGCMEEDSGKYQFSWFVQVRSLGKFNINATSGKQYRIGNECYAAWVPKNDFLQHIKFISKFTDPQKFHLLIAKQLTLIYVLLCFKNYFSCIE